ncbi:AraC family transcriptional regulator [Paenibacillus sp. N3.4]|uniref:helix-turn-helix domain-containing protein n=1 Tax=Paenibacillus sp. N3.4 TaxID=2603222 RepID=UPI0011CBA5BB|nr:AraC family transcriptional regulator [Paenibacillus sp. N3.4]TXK77637.1 helix-turn-helix transcriptional regulator [Paenibacillus sp. N3.4]
MNGQPLKKLFQTNKLFSKILMYFLSLLIPIVIIGLTVYFNVNQVVKKDASQKLMDNLKFSSQTVDIYLRSAQLNNNNLFSNPIIEQNVKPYIQMTNEEKVNLQLIVKALAGNRNAISSFIDHIFMYTDSVKIYTSQEMADFDMFFDKFYRMESYDKEYWKQKLKTSGLFELLPPTKVQSYIESDISRMVIPSVTTQYVNGRLVTMVTSLSLPAIAASLKNNAIFPCTAYLILDKKHQVILNESGFSMEMIEKISKRFTEVENTVFMEVGDEQELIVHMPSEAFGWDYYSITPTKAFGKEPASILSLIFWICITLMIIGVCFSLIFSINLYNPIKNIRNILVQSEKEINFTYEQRSRDELSLIGSRIDQLIQQNRDAVLKVSLYSNGLLDHFFASLFRGQPWAHQETLDQVLNDIGFKGDSYLCCCFMFHYKERFYRDIEEADRLLIQEKMKKLLWGIMQQHVNCYLMEYEHNFYVCMVNLKQEADNQRLVLALDHIKKTFEYDMIYTELIIGLGKTYSKVSDMAKSYSDAITAMDQRKDHSDMAIADAVGLTIEQNYFYSFLDEKKIVNGLKAGNVDVIIAEVDSLIQANKSRGVSYAYLGALLVELWNTGIRYVNERQLDIHILLTEAEYAVLANKNITPNEFTDRVHRLINFYERIVAETLTKGERRTGTVTSFITTFIENNYAKDIYLESIANEIGLSAKYVSRLFKETTGTSITDYISIIRMAKAKELLTETELKINEIAERIGMNSRTTFLRMFKKHEGISPADYRHIHRKKE